MLLILPSLFSRVLKALIEYLRMNLLEESVLLLSAQPFVSNIFLPATSNLAHICCRLNIYTASAVFCKQMPVWWSHLTVPNLTFSSWPSILAWPWPVSYQEHYRSWDSGPWWGSWVLPMWREVTYYILLKSLFSIHHNVSIVLQYTIPKYVTSPEELWGFPIFKHQSHYQIRALKMAILMVSRHLIVQSLNKRQKEDSLPLFWRLHQSVIFILILKRTGWVWCEMCFFLYTKIFAVLLTLHSKKS